MATVAQKNITKVMTKLRKLNPEVKIIGQIQKGKGVWLKTSVGSLKKIEIPRGKLVPRIC